MFHGDLDSVKYEPADAAPCRAMITSRTHDYETQPFSSNLVLFRIASCPFGVEVFVSLLDFCSLLRQKLLQQLEKLSGSERFKDMIGLRTGHAPRTAHDDNRSICKLLQRSNQFRAWYVINSCIEDNSVHSWIFAHRRDCFGTAVRRNDVELRGFNHQLTRRNASGMLLIYNEKTRSHHESFDASFRSSVLALGTALTNL